jgi:hypothetical protein
VKSAEDKAAEFSKALITAKEKLDKAIEVARKYKEIADNAVNAKHDF